SRPVCSPGCAPSIRPATRSLRDDGRRDRAQAAPASRPLDLGRGAQRPLLRGRAGLRGEDAVSARGLPPHPRQPRRPSPGPLRAGGRGAAARGRRADVPLRLGGGRADEPRARPAPAGGGGRRPPEGAARISPPSWEVGELTTLVRAKRGLAEGAPWWASPITASAS